MNYYGRGTGLNGLGIRQRQIIDVMRRNDGVLPSNWRTTSTAVRQSLDALVRRGVIEPDGYSWRLTEAAR